MEVIIRAWGVFVDTITREGKDILTDPFLYLMIILMTIIFLTLYNVTQSRRRKKYSILGVFDYAGKLLIGFIGDGLAALESITNFIDVIRIILMGKLTEATQFLLSNYAIVALSVASFITTMNGMQQVAGWIVAAMVTFGVQVGILSMSYKIAFEWGKKKQDQKRLQQEVSYYDHAIKIKEELKNKIDRSYIEEDQEKSLLGDQQSTERVSGRAIALYGVLLALSMVVSIGFSYLFLFEKWIKPTVPIENYISVVNLVKEQAESYSQSILDYQGALVSELQKYNNGMRAAVEGSMEDVRALNASAERLRQDLQEREEELNRLNTEKLDLEIQQAGVTDETELERIEIQINNLNDQIFVLEEKIEQLEDDLNEVYKDQEGNAVYLRTDAAYRALNLLDTFFADALYLAAAEDIEQVRADLREAFSALIQYTTAAGAQGGEGTESDEDISLIFNNYLNLCAYYAEGLAAAEAQNVTYNLGLNRAAIDSLLSNTAEILEEYSASGQGEDEDAAVINAESARILETMLEILEGVPRPQKWENMSESAESAIVGLNQSRLLNQIYSFYRVSLGKVKDMELAFTKLWSRFSLMCWLMLFLAAFIDSLTVILTLNKSKNNFENALPRYRRLVYRIFIQDELSPSEKRQMKRRRFAGGVGTASGLIFFIAYYIYKGGRENWDNSVLVIALISFVSMFALISLIVVWIYEKVHRDACDWEKDETYQALKTTWDSLTQDAEDENTLRGFLEKAVKRKKSITLTLEQEQELIKLLQSEEENRTVSALKAEARTLFRRIEARQLYKVVWEYKIKYPGWSMKKDYVSGWCESVDCSMVRTKDVKELGMGLAFSVLRREELIGYFEGTHQENGKNPEDDHRNESDKYYVLTKKFLRILYDLIMEAESGNKSDVEYYTFADNLSDVYEEGEINNDN